MRIQAIVITALLFSSPWLAPATAVAADHRGDIHLLGRLNVNKANRSELLLIPELQPTEVDRLLATRVQRPLTEADLKPLGPAQSHLKLDGPSDFRRILQLPLERLSASR